MSFWLIKEEDMEDDQETLELLRLIEEIYLELELGGEG